MFSLVKIRARYLTRHWCGVYCSYLFIPTLLLLSLLSINNDNDDDLNYLPKSKGELIIDPDFSLLNSDISNINEFDFLVEDENDCNIIKNISYSNKCGTDEDLLGKYIVKIKNKKGKYDIQIKSKGKSKIFNEDIFEYYKYIDPFYFKGVNEIDYFENYKGFFELQSLLSKFLIIKKKGETSNKDLIISIGKNAIPEHTNEYYDIMGLVTSFSTIIALEFSMTTYFFNMRMIDEREKKLTILLERQGVTKKKYFFSWLICYLFLAIIPTVTVLLYYIAIVPLHTFLFILNLFLFEICLFAFAYFLYVCISTSKTGSIVGKFIYFSTAILGYPISFPQCSKFTKVILAFFPQINIFLCSNSIDKLHTFKDLSWDKLWLKANNFSYMESIIMYIVEVLFYSFLSIFIEKYKSSGLSFFLFIKSIFTRVSRNINNPESLNLINKNNQENLKFEKHFQEISSINQQRKEQNDCLSIVNISKNFDTLKAVDNFNGDLFGNEIFCLLGHNGAGKTTLVNMITGIHDPSFGDIFYKGKSIITDKDYLFQNIGVCHQEDIFFDYLTVTQHLNYMSEIKGGDINLNEATELILKIGLAEKANSLCGTLSGGQKRKLCTALALIGNSNIIILDEPTSGMDPMSKRSLWDFLKNYQKNKIILITTHSLDEAEYLGDRIGIMSDGVFICCGTSSYLKSKYPCGFNINLLINSQKFNEEKKRIIFDKIKTYEPNAEIKIASKCVFSINIQSNNEHISEIFQFIEESKDEFGIEDYTVASTSLEDVFLKINNRSDLNDMKYSNKEENKEEILVSENLVRMTGCCSQLISQLQRNFLPIKRNKIILLLEFFSGLGIIYVFVFLFNDLILGITKSELNLIDMLKDNDIFIYEQDSMKNYLKNSYAYESGITFTRISTKTRDFSEFAELAYQKAYANIAQSCISIEKDDNNENNWKAQIGQLNIGYLFANTMLVVSSFLKKEYDIDASIISNIELEKEMSIGDEKEIDQDTIGVLIIVCFASVFGFVIYLGGLINEKIKERKTNIKHLLYLSGSNPWSYWFSFFIIDFVKLLIFTLLLIIPIYYVNSSGGYYFLLNMLGIDLSSLMFIYFVSFFGSNAESGVRFLFVLLLSFIVFLIGFLIFALLLYAISLKLINYVFESFSNSYNFTIFDFTPVTSMLLSFGRILYGIANYEGDPLHKYGPGTYLITSYIVQLINFVFYGFLLILMEAGYLKTFLRWIKLKFFISENNFVFSQEEMSQDFLMYNNMKNPIIDNQLYSNQIQPGNNIGNSLNNNIPIYTANNNINNNNINQNNGNFPAVNEINNYNDFMNRPIYGNDFDAINLPINNNINTNQNNNIINTQDNNNNINQPLLNANDNLSNNINNVNSINNYRYNSVENDINDLASPETNRTYNVNKGNPYINIEKEKLKQRKDLTTRIEGLKKTFWFCCKKNVRAIDNLYLGLEANEKFGLLGFNGSGKTTTFRTITNEILYDYGKITLFGHDNQKEFEQIRQRIGYCPQENPLFEFMTVKEILEFYSDLKTCNIPYQIICEKFGLKKYLNTFCINLSGGNKRKLTFAIALMNRPTLLLLDEPSTGVDPESRRFMWKNINELSNTGHQYNMILTTHSMEEAEILCDRVSWLKQGNFICIGNPEKLKIQYSLGYKLHIKFDDNFINQNWNNQRGNIGDAFEQISRLISGFTNYSGYILNYPQVEPYIRALIDVTIKIQSSTKRIILIEIGKDLSFNLVLNIDQNKKQILFSEILSMKNIDKKISEMNISMESLENILTSFI